jgi:hypothetical protein
MRVSAAVPDGQGNSTLSSAISLQQDCAIGTRALAITVVLGLTLWMIAAFFVLIPLYRALLATL